MYKVLVERTLDMPRKKAFDALVNFGGLDKLLLFQTENLSTDNSRHGQPFHCTNDDKQEDNTSFKDRHQENHENRERQCIEDVDKTHHGGIGLPPDVGRGGPVGHPDEKGNRCGYDPHPERNKLTERAFFKMDAIFFAITARKM